MLENSPSFVVAAYGLFIASRAIIGSGLAFAVSLARVVLSSSHRAHRVSGFLLGHGLAYSPARTPSSFSATNSCWFVQYILYSRECSSSFRAKRVVAESSSIFHRVPSSQHGSYSVRATSIIHGHGVSPISFRSIPPFSVISHFAN